jgi:hypothetical protein
MTQEKSDFWKFFDEEAAPKLAHREVSFRKIFKYLDAITGRIVIVETGCARVKDNWSGDGQSTVLFDKYVSLRGAGSRVFSVDINPDAVVQCRSLVSQNVTVSEADSVAYLDRLTRDFTSAGVGVSLFYLDSFDVDWNYWYASAAHHIKELVAAWRSIRPETLVVVDDCLAEARLLIDGNSNVSVFSGMRHGGKGKLVSEFAQAVGADILFSHYQVGWIGFNR